MASIDLNIVDRGTRGSEWTESGVLTADNLDKVIEQKTDNSGALNSLPTPFARFFVAKEAFRRCAEENIDTRRASGFAYRQMVSDILDVYELLFNRKYHSNTWKNGETLELREWDSRENLEVIKQKMPVLYNSVESYYKNDIKEDKLHFLVYTEDGHEYLLACSSPMTGFVTPQDMDKHRKRGTNTYVFAGEQYDNLHIRRKSGGEYFRDIRMFEERNADFKNYMYNEIFGKECDARFKEIKDYVLGFRNDRDIRNDYQIRLTPLKTSQNDDFVINGLKIMTSDEIDINNYFTETMIKLPYRISRDAFSAVNYQNDTSDRDYDYLLPFKPDVVTLFAGGNVDSSLHINRNSATVILRYAGKTYEKEYAVEPVKAGQGRIIDLQMAKINFDLGLFPNILSYKESENNYFKILVVGADEDPEAPQFNIEQIELAFFKKGKRINEVSEDSGASSGLRPSVIRSQQTTSQEESGTKFYELFNTAFDLIEVKILNQQASGLLFPHWRTSSQTGENYTYAIDLGTSNTFMSRCKNGADGNPDLSKQPELFKMDSPMVCYMHEVPADEQYSLSRRIENSIFEKAKNRIKTEFLPALIDGSAYKFPIRTALCGIHDKTKLPQLFDNHNIAFFYEKMMSRDDQEIYTDIKWKQEDKRLRVFAKELLLIIKCDILQRNGELGQTNLVWFSPLSFEGTEKETYEDIWTSEAKSVLTIGKQQIRQYSESEAPYYYYKKKNYIKDSDAVTVIDIGGGSTDFVYFKDNQPVVANSVHFGCDVLWENGFNEFGNARENGIYKRYENSLRFRNRQDLEALNESFKHVETASTKDIINFWMSNAEHCDIMKSLRTDFKAVFVYHLISILFYMASMYKENQLDAPKTIVFSGNGSKYIDNFITSDQTVLKKIVDQIFARVFGGEHDVNIKLPEERKESTCYGGLYRSPDAERVKAVIYQGDCSYQYETVGDMNKNFVPLKTELMAKYDTLAELYDSVLTMLKRENIIDRAADTSKYVGSAKEDMGTPLATYYKTQVKERFADVVPYADSVFFLPIINKIFEMTKI